MKHALALFLLVAVGCSPLPDAADGRNGAPGVHAPVPRIPDPSAEWTALGSEDLPWQFYDAEDVAVVGSQIVVGGGVYKGDGSADRTFGLIRVVGGSLDTSFGDGGLARSFTQERDGYVADVLAASFGLIGCGRLNGGTFASARLDQAGNELGPDYGGATIGELSLDDSFACQAAVEVPGGYILAGEHPNGHGLWRFKADGTADESFGDGGLATVERREDGCCLRDLSQAPDGSLYAAVYGARYVIKLLGNGTLDRSFGVDGYLSIDGSPISIQAVPSGFVVAGFRGEFQPFLARYFANGALDESFGEGGTIVLDRTGTFMDTDRAGESLIAVGYSENGGLIVRVDAAGQVDTAFGVKDLPLGPSTRFNAVELLGDGSAVAVGADPLVYHFVVE